MKLMRLRLCNFRSFGEHYEEIDLADMTFLLGPNGTGKTAVLQAIARMFSLDPAQRKIKRSDFHVPVGEEVDDVPDERELWIEADFEFPELLSEEEEQEDMPAVPGGFAHMQLTIADGPPQIRFRLKAVLDSDGEIEETFTYVVTEGPDGAPLEESRVSKQDRSAIQVHYLPARRDPADHISYAANALLGRALRAADWSAEREQIVSLTDQITEALVGNSAIDGIAEALTSQWGEFHKGVYYASPAVSFARSEIDGLLRHLSVGFTPGHGEPLVDFSRLSDGQQSLLYMSLVLAMHQIGMQVLGGELGTAFDIDKLRPAVFTLIAVEEPENSLSAHYLGRVIKNLTTFAEGRDAQAIVATHSASLLRRVPPESVRYLRLNEDRTTVVKKIELPNGVDARKFVREAVQAFPELYFSRLVILGEGDSEEVVLPRLLAARGILADDASVSIVPLGGRHVNHFWRLLHGLGIPHVTLLDLDLARFQGGWGRVKYAANQLRKYSDMAEINITVGQVEAIPAWDGNKGFAIDDLGWTERLEDFDVFFSAPLDLDFMMMEAYPEAYEVEDEDLGEEDDEEAQKLVLGKSHDIVEDQYSVEQQKLFDAYHSKFQLGSKPTWHLRAMSALSDEEFLDDLPPVFERLFDRIETLLEDLPE